jgi:protein involved in polysaccharide export with SLBB domain
MIRRLYTLILFFALLCVSVSVQAQFPSGSIQFTDQQLIQLFGLGTEKMVKPSQLENRAIELGFTPAQLPELKKRLEQLRAGAAGIMNKEALTNTDVYDARRQSTGTKRLYRSVPTDSTATSLSIFGADLFETEELSFTPDLSIATPQNYLLGAGDQLIIDVFGVSDLTQKLRVSPEGFIRYPNYGPIKVGGLSIETATVSIKSALSKIYPGIRSGAVQLQVSLGQIRSIRVTLIGEVKRPGTVTVSSLSTLLNALYLSGGPTDNGSLRNIQLVRNGKKLVDFDLYDFLFRGDLSKNLLLQDGDVIRLAICQTRVALKGAFNKPALYEAGPHETAKDLIAYAGGISPMAVKDIISVVRMGTTRREALSITPEQLATFKLLPGDTLLVDPLNSKFNNRILVTGEVERPGLYGAKEIGKLSTLMALVSPTEEAYLERGILRRINQQAEPTLLSFNIHELRAGKFDMQLQSEDSVHIFNKDEIRESLTVTINGEVNKPGKYNFFSRMSAMDLVLMAGGFNEGASLSQIEISRRLRSANSQSDTSVYAVIKTINLSQGQLAAEIDDELQPFDIVSVRRSPAYKSQLRVNLEGEVLFPGTYTLSGKEERLSDLIKRAGGLRDQAFAQGATLLRTTYTQNFISDTLMIAAKNELYKKNNEGSEFNELVKKDIPVGSYDQDSLLSEIKKRFLKPVGIQLNEALRNPGSTADIFLEEGDVLRIPRQLQTVQTFGAVNVPKQIVYSNGLTYRGVIRQSGGFAANAYRKRGYAVYANGQVSNARQFLFFRFNPRIKPGAEIYIPLKSEKRSLSTGEAVSIISGLASVLGFLVVILRQ